MAQRRLSRLPAGMTQLYLFPGDVGLRPARPSRLACAEHGHSWHVGKQARLFGLPPEDMVYCVACGQVRRP